MPDLFPTEEMLVDSNISGVTGSEVKFGRSWRFDFDAGDFVLTPHGKVAQTTDLDAYIEWCKKTLLTPRYRHLIYSRNYGAEFDDLIGRGLARAAIESEIKRMVTDALTVDPRTASVENFTFSLDGDAVSFTCQVTSVRGETTEIGSKVVIS